WLTGACGKTLVHEAELDRAENSGSGGDFREEASKAAIDVAVYLQVGAAQAQPGPSRQVQQQTGSQPDSRVRRRFRRSRRLSEQRQLPVESVQQPDSLPSPQVVRSRLSRFEELCLSVVGLVLLL
ncbi:hypothetical protein Taro_040417, partial [Colocasia esculenta]|nr:hypothetical protein [Colocasia esculenta]